MDKKIYIKMYRDEVDNYISEKNFVKTTEKKEYKDQTRNINKLVSSIRSKFESNVLGNKEFNNKQIVDELLKIYYTSYIMMLEYRNKFWPYDNMAFSRRIGEFWEPLCKIPFYHSLKKLQIFEPKTFSEIEIKHKEKMKFLISNLISNVEEGNKVFNLYDEVWNYINSESIQLALDLHFIQDNIYYNIDYKSGFSSNEKGNTNRLLMVAGIDESLKDLFNEKHKNILLVRQKEYENNHYLIRLKDSSKWEVFCGDDAYEKIKHFTGFDLKEWISSNVNWESDLSRDFYEYLHDKDLLRYLEW
ncbi:hypothetical protein [Ligilactobacillus salivarius]|uniref:Uncharacterized protein n=1 Tax=Ligilactobacillus salivarius TaxID=1624 RepID=A0A1V9QQ16_9LACO|nr:hypothetical protein [Ligilactobacillus salivarius]OQQ83006.1 hypothetical protein B6U60_06570 [Ligilactobacillus salivarius]OQQ86047.1 hypothetical protein B6U59_06725 [Ligilactobacillus salivarius]